MSEENKTNQEPGVEDSGIVRAGEKEFDTSTPEGKAQLQAWMDGITHRIGAQGHELGDLRKFKAVREISADRQKVLQQVAALRLEEKHAEADDLLFSHFDEREIASQQRQKDEAFNNKLWTDYFSSRKELKELYGEEFLKSRASGSLDLPNLERPMEALDGLFADEIRKAKLYSVGEADGTPAIQSKAGGSTAPKAPPQEPKDEPEAVDFNQVLDDASVYKRK